MTFLMCSASSRRETIDWPLPRVGEDNLVVMAVQADNAPIGKKVVWDRERREPSENN